MSTSLMGRLILCGLLCIGWVMPTKAMAETVNVYLCWKFPDDPRLFNCRIIGSFDRGGAMAVHYAPEGNAGGGGRSGSRGSSEMETCSVAKEKLATSLPVIISSGEKMLPELDFAANGDYSPLGIGRNYYSGNTEAGAFGSRWSSTIDYGLMFEHGAAICRASLSGSTTCDTSTTGLTKITVKRPGGSAVSFLPNGSGGWISGSQDYVLEPFAGGWLYWEKDGTNETYNAGGQPLEIRSETENGWNFNYASGKLASIGHTSGSSMAINWVGTKVASVVAPNNKTYSYTYNAAGYLADVTFPDGLGVRTYHYEVYSKPWLITGISIDGTRYSRYSYQSDGRVSESGLEGGYDKSSFAYYANSTSITNALGQTETYALTADKRIASVSRPATSTCAGGSTLTQYGADSRVSKSTDGDGNSTEYYYNAQGRLSEKRAGIASGGSTANQQITQYVWDSTGTRVDSIKEYGSTLSSFIKETAYTYYVAPDPYGRQRMVSSITEYDRSATAAPSRTTTYDYRFHANRELSLMTVDGPLAGTADTVRYEYDTLGNLTKLQDEVGNATLYSLYNGLKLPGRSIDPNGLITDIAYDAKGRVMSQSVQAPTGIRTTSYTYTALDKVATIVDPSGRTTTLDYDSVGRLARISQPAAHVEPLSQNSTDVKTFFYNNLNQVTSSSTLKNWLKRVVVGYDYLGEPITEWVTQYSEYAFELNNYDLGGFLSSQQGSSGQNVRSTYNASGNIASRINSLNGTTTFGYDSHGRIATVQAINGATAVYSYDALGRISSIKDHNNVSTTFSRNGFGEVVSVASPDTGTKVFAYDGAGQKASISNPDGSVISYVRDASGRITSESATWPTGSANSGTTAHTYTYDSCTSGKGRVCSITDATGYTTYTYLSSGETASQTSSIHGVTFGTTFTYDAYGRLYTTTYPGGQSLRYSYTADHRVARIEANLTGTWQNVISNAAYQSMGGGLLGFTYGNGLLLDNDQDIDGRLIKIQTKNGAGFLQNLTLAYNANNYLTAVTNGTNAAASQTYGYSPSGYLTSVSGTASGAHTWTYDANGNRTSHAWGGATDTYTMAAGTNRLASISGSRPRTLSYDGGGSVRYDARGGSTSERRYNGFGRLVELVRPAAQTFTLPTGASTTLPAGTWQYGYNALGQRASKLNVPSAMRSRYLYSPSGVMLGEANANATTLDTIYIWLEGKPVGLIRGAQLYMVHGDHHGRPELVTNSAKAVVWKANNYAFDRTVTLNTLGGLNLGFPGQYEDAEAATWQNYYRDYDSAIGRYVESDPLGVAGSLNVFAYANNNPSTLNDPFGLKALCEAMDEVLATNNDFINGSMFPVDQLAQEYVPAGGHGPAGSNFTHTDGKDYDIQYVQVGWSLTQNFSRAGAHTAYFGWMMLAALMQDKSYFKPDNILPNTRAMEMAMDGAEAFESFKEFVDSECHKECPK